jgi:hypothetical protein
LGSFPAEGIGKQENRDSHEWRFLDQIKKKQAEPAN